MTAGTAPAVPLEPAPARGVRPALSRLARRMGGREAAAGMLILGVLVIVAALAPWIAPHDLEAIEA